MADHMMVKPGDAFDTAHAVAVHAQELREELDQLARDWDNLSHSWSGVAASAFSSAWSEWHDGAAKLTDSLAESAERLAKAAVLYEQQDADAAQAVQLASPEAGA
jgi:WXG100 family type VII secretion target